MTDRDHSAPTHGPPVRVPARRPVNPSVARLRFREAVAPSLWFLPTLMITASLVVSRVVVVVDRDRGATTAPAWLLGADAVSAGAFTTTVAAAMLTFAAVVFSTTLVAIQLAGGQYSPRVVRVFVRSRLTQVTLGIYLSTFVFALSGIVEERSGASPYVPAITLAIVYVLVIASVFAFIAFVFGMSRLLRVQYVLGRVARDGRTALREAFVRPDDAIEVDNPVALLVGDGAARPPLRNARDRVGVVQAVDVAGLVADASARGVVLEVLVGAGEYVGVGTPVARVLDGPPASVDGDTVTARFVLGAERTLQQDPGFAFRQLVDIAIRALSPAVNDPTTAAQCVDRMSDLLGDVATHPEPSGWYVDGTGRPRVLLRVPTLADLLQLSFVEIIRYGADSPQVVRRLRAAFDVLEPQVHVAAARVVEQLRTMLDANVREAMPAPFVEFCAVGDRRGLG